MISKLSILFAERFISNLDIKSRFASMENV
jgi:hypothetical protein